MADQSTHGIDDCIFAKSKWQIFTDIESGEILYISPETTKLLSASLPEQQEPVNFKGKSIFQFISPCYSNNLKEGVIVPAELTNSQNPEYSKWIFSCCHPSADSSTGKKVLIWALEDISSLKKEIKENLQNPLQLVSVDVPDFITDGNTTLGNCTCLRASEQGVVLQIFPFESFLGIAREKLVGHNLMGAIVEEDQAVFAQLLSEAHKSGKCNGIVRWNSSPTGNWVQVKVMKDSPVDEMVTMILVFQELVDKNHSESLVDQAWAYLASPIRGQMLPTPSTGKFPTLGLPNAPSLSDATQFLTNQSKSVFSLFATTPKPVPAPNTAAKEPERAEPAKILKSDVLQDS